MSIFTGTLDVSLSLLTCLTLTRLASSLTVHRRIPFEVLSNLALLESQGTYATFFHDKLTSIYTLIQHFDSTHLSQSLGQ